MTYIYYLAKNEIPFYIGKTKHPTKRIWEHKHKKGIDITIHVIDECEDDKQIWKPLECYWIEQFKAWGFGLTNLNKGGGGLNFCSDETKYKMSLIHLGNKNRLGLKNTESSKQKLSKALKGKPNLKLRGRICTIETKEKISNSNKGKKLTQETKNKISNYHKTKTVSDETKIKIGKSKLGNNYALGNKLTEEQKQKITLSKLGKKQSKDTINKRIISKSKAILQLDKDENLIKEWNSITEAANNLKLHRGNITKCAKGKAKFIGGFKWKYKN